MKKYYKINEISKLYNIGQDSLRYYEKLGLLSPKRGSNGYRQYSSHDIYRLNIIKDMRNLGFSTAQIHNYLENRSVDNSICMFEDELKKISEKIQQLEDMKEEIQMRLCELNKIKLYTFDSFEIVDMPVRKCVTLNESFKNDEEVDFLLTKLSRLYEPVIFMIGNENTGLVIDLNSLEYKSVIVIADSLKWVEYELPAGKYLVSNVHGKMDPNFEQIKKMKKFIKENGLKADSKALELIVIDEHETANQKEYITQYQIHLLED